jgi:hypothetical protein
MTNYTRTLNCAAPRNLGGRILLLFLGMAASLEAQRTIPTKRNPERPRNAANQVRLAIEATMGAGKNENATISHATDLVVTSRGEVAVLDAKSSNVKLFGADGRLIRTIGRKGKGPGELLGPRWLLLGRGDTINVVDMLNARVQPFTPDGIAHTALATPFDGLPFGHFIGTDGAVYQVYRKLTVVNGKGVFDSTFTVRRLQPQRTITVGSIPIVLASATLLYSPQGALAADRAGRVFVVPGAAFEVLELNDDLHPSRVVTRNGDVEPIAQGDRRFLLRTSTLTRTEGKISDSEVEEVVESVLKMTSFAERYPAYVGIRLAHNGDIWLQRPITADDLRSGAEAELDLDSPGSRRWDVYSREGEYLAEVVFPKRFKLMQLSGGKAYGSAVGRDESVVVQRIAVTFAKR